MQLTLNQQFKFKKMKKISTLLFYVLLTTLSYAQSIIYNGEDINPTWNNLVSTVSNNVINPDKTGINASDHCVSIVRRGSNIEGDGKDPWAGGRLYSLNIDHNKINRIYLMVKKATNGPVAIEVQRAVGFDEYDKDFYTAEYNGNGEWQKIIFDIHCRGAVINNLLVQIHSTGVPADFEEVMYWDNLEVDYVSNYPIIDGVMTLYNGEEVNSFWGNIVANVNQNVPNPDKTGINTSDFCVSVLRNNSDTDNGGRGWSGGALWGCEKVRISPSSYNRLSVMVKKPVAGPVTLELQKDGIDNQFITVQYTEQNINQWQNLIFDISSRSEEIYRILIRPHDTNEGLAAEGVQMYWDNFRAYYDVTNNVDLNMFKPYQNLIRTEVYTLAGVLKLRTEKKLSSDSLCPGIYIVKEYFENGQTTNRKLLIDK